MKKFFALVLIPAFMILTMGCSCHFYSDSHVNVFDVNSTTGGVTRINLVDTKNKDEVEAASNVVKTNEEPAKAEKKVQEEGQKK